MVAPLIPLLMGLSGLQYATNIASSFYQANAANELYSKQLEDYKQQVADFHKNTGRTIKYQNLGPQGQINAIQKNMEMNRVLPWFGAVSGGIGLAKQGAYYSYQNDLYSQRGNGRRYSGNTSRYLPR